MCLDGWGCMDIAMATSSSRHPLVCKLCCYCPVKTWEKRRLSGQSKYCSCQKGVSAISMQPCCTPIISLKITSKSAD